MKRFMITWTGDTMIGGYADFKPDECTTEALATAYRHIAREDEQIIKALKIFVSNAEIGDSIFDNKYGIARLKDVEGVTEDGINSQS